MFEHYIRDHQSTYKIFIKFKFYREVAEFGNLKSVNERYSLQCIINSSSASPKRHLKTAGLHWIILFFIVAYLVRDHQSIILVCA